jgi:hypothetical protein
MSEIRVNNITNREGSAGPSVAGIPVVDSNSHFVVPTGRTWQRYVDGGENIVRDGLVLYLDAKYSYPGASGTNPDTYTWYDLSGNENHGELKNGVSYSGTGGGSLVFDGVNDYVNVPFSPNFPTGSSSRTLTSFFNVSNLTGGKEIFGIGSNSGTGSRSSLWVDSTNKIGIECANTAVITTNWSGVNNWVYLCVVLPSGLTTTHSFLIYVNGALVSSEIIGSDVTLNTTNLQCVIGTVPGANSAHMFVGNIAQVSIYNRALTAEEVLQNFNATRSRYGI